MWPLSSFIATTFLLCHVLASTPVKGGCSWEVFVSGLEGEIVRDLCSFSPRHDFSLLFSCRNQNRSVCIQPIKSLDVEGCEEESQSAPVPVVLTGTNYKALDIDLALVINVNGNLEAVDTFRVHKEMYTGNRSGIQLLNVMGNHRKTRIQITLRQVCSTTGLTPLQRKRREEKLPTADDVTVKTETSVKEELGKDDVIFSGEGEQAQTTTDERVPVFDDITKELLPTVLELDMKSVKVATKEVPARDGDVKNQLKKVIITDDLSGKASRERSDLRDSQTRDVEDRSKMGGKDIDVNMNNTRKSLSELLKNPSKVHLKAESISLALKQNQYGSSKQNQVSVPFRKKLLSPLKTTKEHQTSSLDDFVNESLDKLQVQMRSNGQTGERPPSTSANHPTTTSSESESTFTASTLNDRTSHLPTTTPEDELTTQQIETLTIEHTNKEIRAATLAQDPTSFSSSQDKASTHLENTTEFIEEEKTTTQKLLTTSQSRTSSDDTNGTSTVKIETNTKKHDDPLDSKRVVYSGTDDEPLIAQADEDTPRGVKEITDQDFLEKLMQSLRNQSNIDEDIGPQTPLSFSKPEVPTTSPLSSQSTVQPVPTSTILSQQSTAQPVQPRDVWFGRNNSKLLRSGDDSEVDGSATSTTEAVTAKPPSTATSSSTTIDQDVISSTVHDSPTRTSTTAGPTTKETSSSENLSTVDPTTTTSEISKNSTGKATVSNEPAADTVPLSNSLRNSESSTSVAETMDTTRSSSAPKNKRTTPQEDGPTTTDLNLGDSSNTTSTKEPLSDNTTDTESPQRKSSTERTQTISTSASTPSSESTASESTASESTASESTASESTASDSTASESTTSTRPPTSTDGASSNEPSTTRESTTDTSQSSTTEQSTDNTTEEVTKTLSSTSSHSETPEITTVDEVIPGHTPGPLLATSSEAKRRRFPGETGDEEEFWPIVAGLVIGIPSIIVFGIAITVIHKRRLGHPSSFSSSSMYPSL